jgi:hypothetical protein
VRIKIAHARLAEGTEMVLRGTPTAVDEIYQTGATSAGGGQILYFVEDDADSIYEEDELWQRFVTEAKTHNQEQTAWAKYQIWRRKAAWLWNHDTTKMICFFPLHDDDMVLSVHQRDLIDPSQN